MPNAEASISSKREIVCFSVAEQDFCVDIGAVREIRGWAPTTILPHSPPFIRGVMNLRGTVLPVMDLSTRLGLAAGDPSHRHVIIIAMIGSRMVGLLVDAVSDILSVPADEFRPTPDVASESAQAFVESIIAVEGRLIRLLDLSALLPDAQEAAA